MYLEETIKRKIRIRNEAYQNMVGEGTSYNLFKLSDIEREKLAEKLYYECNKIDEYSCNKVYTEIFARNKLILFVKKAIRKISYITLGWYYVPIIEGQIETNRQLKESVIDLQRMVSDQQQQINDLKEHTNEDN